MRNFMKQYNTTMILGILSFGSLLYMNQNNASSLSDKIALWSNQLQKVVINADDFSSYIKLLKSNPRTTDSIIKDILKDPLSKKFKITEIMNILSQVAEKINDIAALIHQGANFFNDSNAMAKARTSTVELDDVLDKAEDSVEQYKKTKNNPRASQKFKNFFSSISKKDQEIITNFIETLLDILKKQKKFFAYQLGLEN